MYLSNFRVGACAVRYGEVVPYADRDEQRRYQREWKARRREAWLREHGPCVDCGSWDDLRVDHVDAKQKVDHKVWTWSQERRDQELAKCVVRCHPCHVAKTARQQEGTLGEVNGKAKLTTAQVLEIRASPDPSRDVAVRFGISQDHVSRLRRGGRWGHLPPPADQGMGFLNP